MARVCLGLPDGRPCPTRAVTDRTRCPSCERVRQRQRGTPDQRGLDADYRRNRAVVMAAAQGRCYFRGCRTTATTCDHIVPRRDGGGNEVGNLRASCPAHNYGRR